MLSTFSIDTLPVLGSAVTGFILEEVDGLGMPDVRQSAGDNPGEDGGYISSEHYSPRTLSFKGTVMGSDVATYLAARKALGYACRIQRDNSGLLAPTTMTFNTLDGASYFVNAFIKPGYKCDSPYPTWAPFQFSFLVNDSAIYGTELLTTGLVTRQTGGGATFPLTFPITFTSGNPGTGVITNYGNLDTYPLIYLRGTHTNPRIYAIERAASFQLNYTTTNVTDVIIIDMKNKTVMLNGNLPLLQYVQEINWFSLLVGQNTLQLTSGALADSGSMEATAHPAYIAI